MTEVRKVTVAICTWNRSELLDQTLQQFQKLQIPDSVDWELLVVNNNCTDGTDEALARHASALPMRRLFEAKPGLSNARNCIIDHATGDLILWTDDDVLVSECWLKEYVESARAYPEAAFFGGPVLPWFQGTPPTWLEAARRKVPAIYALIDLGNEPHDLRDNRVPFGANYGVRRSVQEKYRYDPDLGRKKEGLIGGEETTVLRAMVANGHYGRWVPESTVRHFVPQERQSLKYVRRIFYGPGAVEARNSPTDGVPFLFGKPRWLYRAALLAEFRYRIGRILSTPDTWLDHLVASSQLWGRLIGK